MTTRSRSLSALGALIFASFAITPWLAACGGGDADTDLPPDDIADSGTPDDTGDAGTTPADDADSGTPPSDDPDAGLPPVETPDGEASPTCTDGVMNGDETDVDCGGSCPDKCADGQGCEDADDCESGFCDPDTNECAAAPTCADGVKNGDETDVDCGGSCPDKCADDEGCETADDCESGVCDPDANQCSAPTCTDGVMNGDETDVDCGGSCPDQCADTKGCETADDCESGVCDPDTNECSAPTCTDGVMNGDETDVDCGGSCPDKCANSQGCEAAGDCKSGVCDADTNECIPCAGGADCESGVCDPDTNECSAPTCTDGVMNGDEVDVDCGGSCPMCACSPNDPNSVIHDDGEAENGYGWNPSAGYARIAEPFTPPAYPATIASVCAAFITNQGVESFNFSLVVYADDGEGGKPGTVLGSKDFVGHPTSPSGVPATPPFESFDVSDLDLTIESGRVFISVEWDPTVEPSGVFLGADESSETPQAGGFAHKEDHGDWLPIQTDWDKYRTMLLRATMPAR